MHFQMRILNNGPKGKSSVLRGRIMGFAEKTEAQDKLFSRLNRELINKAKHPA